MSRVKEFLKNRFKDRAIEWRRGGHKQEIDGKVVTIAKEISTWDGRRMVKANVPVEVILVEATTVNNEVVLNLCGKITAVTIQPGDYVTVGEHDSSLVLSVKKAISAETSELRPHRRAVESQTK